MPGVLADGVGGVGGWSESIYFPQTLATGPPAHGFLSTVWEVRTEKSPMK